MFVGVTVTVVIPLPCSEVGVAVTVVVRIPPPPPPPEFGVVDDDEEEAGDDVDDEEVLFELVNVEDGETVVVTTDVSVPGWPDCVNVVITVDTIVVGCVIVDVSMGKVILPVKVGAAGVVEVEVEVEVVEFAEVGRREVELNAVVTVGTRVAAVEFVTVTEVEVDSGVDELVRIILEVVAFAVGNSDMDVLVLLFAVEVALIPVEVGKGNLVELVGTVAFVFPSLPEIQDIFIDGEAD